MFLKVFSFINLPWEVFLISWIICEEKNLGTWKESNSISTDYTSLIVVSIMFLKKKFVPNVFQLPVVLEMIFNKKICDQFY